MARVLRVFRVSRAWVGIREGAGGCGCISVLSVGFTGFRLLIHLFELSVDSPRQR